MPQRTNALASAPPGILDLSQTNTELDIGSTLKFGAAKDTNIYRNSANFLKTDSSFAATGTLYGGWTGTAWGITVGADGKLVFSGDANANLYRDSPAVIKTDSDFQSIG